MLSIQLLNLQSIEVGEIIIFQDIQNALQSLIEEISLDSILLVIIYLFLSKHILSPGWQFLHMLIARFNRRKLLIQDEAGNLICKRQGLILAKNVARAGAATACRDLVLNA